MGSLNDGLWRAIPIPGLSCEQCQWPNLRLLRTPTPGKRKLLCLPVCAVKKARLQSMRDSHFRQMYSGKLKQALASSFAYSNGHYLQAFLFAPEVSTCF